MASLLLDEPAPRKGDSPMDPFFLARILAASVVALALALCAGHAPAGSGTAPHLAATSADAAP
jgi:hypothetical protein